MYRPNKLGGFLAAPSFLLPRHAKRGRSLGVGSALWRGGLVHAALTLNVFLHDGRGRMAGTPNKMAPCPKTPHVSQVRKLLTQDAACVAFDHLDNLCAADVGRDLDKQVYVVWHDLHGSNRAAQSLHTLIEQFGQSRSHVASQDAATVLRAKDDVVIYGVNAMALMCMFHVFFGLPPFLPFAADDTALASEMTEPPLRPIVAGLAVSSHPSGHRVQIS